MAYDQKVVQYLYKKLLRFYPRAFRERLGDSMEQTFNDLWKEQKGHSERGAWCYVLWLFVETAIGIIREHVIVVTQGGAMKTIAKDLRLAAIISFIIVLPFAILESLNNTVNKQNVTGLVLLFGILWLLPTVFLVLFMPLVRTVRAGASLLTNPISLLIRATFLTLIATIWAWGFLDQLPCFFGVPNCD